MSAPEYQPAAVRWPERRAATEAEAKALASGIRLRILRLCLDQELTNKEIAERLGANPATALHHVRTLVDTGFLEALPPRRGKRGSREVPYLATGKSWGMDDHESGVAGRGAAMVDAFLDEVRGVDLDNETLIARLGLRLTREQYTELCDRINGVLRDFAALPLAPEGRPYSLFVVAHEDIGRTS
jgi:DNA-binding transcriptional ArsR family regulator